MGKESSLTHFPLEPGCEDYSFLDKAVATFEQGLDSILTDSIETPKLDTSLDEPDVINSSVSSGFPCLVNSVSDTSKPMLAPCIKSHKLWCQARTLLSHVSLPTKMLASKLICYFSSDPAAFGFQSSTPPDNITMNPANRKADESLSGWHWCSWSCSFLTSELSLLIPFPLYQILKEEWFLFQECMNYLSRFMIFWTMLCLNQLVTQLIF